MGAISNPAHARGGDRRRTRRQLDEAFARGVITEADRATRLAHVDAATTKGDLAMVVRDLDAYAASQRAQAVHQWPATPPPSQTSPSQTSPSQTSPSAISGGSGLRVAVVGVVLAAVLMVAGTALLVTLNIGSTSSPAPPTVSAPSGDTEAADPFGPQRWDAFLQEMESEVGTTEATSLSFYEDAVYVQVQDGNQLTTHLLRDGEWEISGWSYASPSTKAVDLTELPHEGFGDFIRQAQIDRGYQDEEDLQPSVFLSTSGEEPVVGVQLYVPGLDSETVRYTVDGEELSE